MPVSAVCCDSSCRPRGERLAAELALPLVIGSENIAGRQWGPGDYVLEITEDGVAVRSAGPRSLLVRCDFVAGALAHRRRFGGGRGQAIARAIGIKGGRSLAVADLTAGLGRDGFVLATLGARVWMLERHPVVSALLADGLARAAIAARDDLELQGILARMTQVAGDGTGWLQQLAEPERPDVIYLDPMFPERGKSARVKKEMAVLQEIVGADDDADQLLCAALTCARYRVVVKRPRLAPVLGTARPGYSLEGKSTRYDIYPLRKMPD